jgi:hypothetical protein
MRLRFALQRRWPAGQEARRRMRRGLHILTGGIRSITSERRPRIDSPWRERHLKGRQLLRDPLLDRS